MFSKNNLTINSDTASKFRGKLIVIDGTDGSGKATQTQLTIERLKQAGYEVEMVDFPQYGYKSAGLVENYLNGKYGTAVDVGPYRASLFFAVDRYDASFRIRQWLETGKVVVANRYVTANMAHQGGKIDDSRRRQEYFNWLFQLEYGLFKIPRPDLNIILHVDAALAQTLVDQKGARAYLGGEKRDLHEADIEHLRQAEKVYLEIAQNFPNFELIECIANDQMMTREQINDIIWEKIKTIIDTPSAETDLGQLIKQAYPILAEEKINPNIDTKIIEVTTINPFVSDLKNISANPRLLRPEEKELQSLLQFAPELVVKAQKLTPEAKLPTRAHADDAGLDLYANDNYTLYENERVAIGTGIIFAIPEGYAGLIWDKSGLAVTGLKTMGGVIDATYRGEIKVIVINLSGDIFHIAQGQKIAQLLIQPIKKPALREVSRLDETERGEGGFGSTGV